MKLLESASTNPFCNFFCFVLIGQINVYFQKTCNADLKCPDVEFVDEWTTILSLDDFLKRYPTLKVLQIEGYDEWLSKEKVENGMEVIIRKAN